MKKKALHFTIFLIFIFVILPYWSEAYENMDLDNPENSPLVEQSHEFLNKIRNMELTDSDVDAMVEMGDKAEEIANQGQEKFEASSSPEEKLEILSDTMHGIANVEVDKSDNGKLLFPNSRMNNEVKELQKKIIQALQEGKNPELLFNELKNKYKKRLENRVEKMLNRRIRFEEIVKDGLKKYEDIFNRLEAERKAKAKQLLEKAKKEKQAVEENFDSIKKLEEEMKELEEDYQSLMQSMQEYHKSLVDLKESLENLTQTYHELRDIYQGKR